MACRVLVILAVCGSTLASSALGLRDGMMLAVDEHGHFRIDHAQHAHAHAHGGGGGGGGGADHEPHDNAPGADHAVLHAALMADTDACAHGIPERSGEHAGDLPSLSVMPFFNALPARSSSRTGSSDAHGSTALAENARLRTVVLVI